jgi:predicted O-methyltransferase YrrM
MSTADAAVLELERSGEPLPLAVAAALRAAARAPEGEEAERLAAIERRRERLLAREDRLQGYTDLSVGAACGRASKSARDAIVLFRLIRELRPSACLELGTNLGISGAYQASALVLNGSGRMITLEGHAGRASIARETFAELGLSGIVDLRVGRFDATLQDALQTPVDYAFIDGDHNEEPTIAYFEQISAAATRGALLVFDDIRWSDGMRRAWDRIAADPRLIASVALDRMGICALGGAG